MDNILNIEGIVIRLIPKETVKIYSYNEYNKKLLKRSNTKIFYSNYHKKNMIKETKINSLGGNYIITTAYHQDTKVSFCLKYCGIGSTVKLAYLDYKKGSK